ncbi:MAG: nuclear transport factor 2 family protein [Chloroflexota bacterium]
MTTQTYELAWTAEPVDETITPEVEAAIRATCLDYFEGWFDGDPLRMDRALHEVLAKHAFGQGPDRSGVDVITKDDMIEATRRGLGRSRDLPDRAIRIDIASVSGDMASVVAHSAVYVEYLLLARTGEGWKITSALWRWATGNGPRA